MLKNLTVQNYALIDELQLQFGKGLNIITGETGAGKSVLMGALGLLLGDRTDSASLLDKTKKCLIKGEFHASEKVKLFLEKMELDADIDLYIHREINKDGKSRSFINDTPVSLSVLKELGNLLVDIHSQHETLLLNQSEFQLSVVDAFASNEEKLNEYQIIYRQYRAAKQTLIDLKEEEKRIKADQDYLQFQFDELSEAAIVPGEQLQLEEELSALSHSEEIKSGIDRFTQSVSGSDSNIISGLSSASNIISGLSIYLASLDDLSKRLKALEIELKDIEYEVEQVSEKISFNPQRLEIINERLNLIYRLEQKHRVTNVEELLQILDNVNEKLSSFNSLEERILATEKQTELLLEKVKTIAIKLSDKRKKSIPSIELKIKKLLSELAMPDAVLKIELTELNEDAINQSGCDKVRFLFSANKGIPYSDISKVASGGELSRLMLCLKSSVATLIELPTIVFDEIDTGVSGETAFKIGKVMQELSVAHQLIAITHLPQIASRGEDHFFVYKEVSGKKTFTKVRKLSTDERIVEVARMLSGDKPTAVAMENAKELLSF